MDYSNPLCSVQNYTIFFFRNDSRIRACLCITHDFSQRRPSWGSHTVCTVKTTGDFLMLKAKKPNPMSQRHTYTISELFQSCKNNNKSVAVFFTVVHQQPAAVSDKPWRFPPMRAAGSQLLKTRIVCSSQMCKTLKCQVMRRDLIFDVTDRHVGKLNGSNSHDECDVIRRLILPFPAVSAALHLHHNNAFSQPQLGVSVE